MVAEGISDDGCGHLQDVLADRGGSAGDGGDAEAVTRAASDSGCIGCPARRPGNSQRESRFVAVFMLSRFSIHSRSRNFGLGHRPATRSASGHRRQASIEGLQPIGIYDVRHHP